MTFSKWFLNCLGSVTNKTHHINDIFIEYVGGRNVIIIISMVFMNYMYHLHYKVTLAKRNTCLNISAYTFTRSPFFKMTSASDFRGEKWHTQLLTETQVGNAIPEEKKFVTAILMISYWKFISLAFLYFLLFEHFTRFLCYHFVS